MLAVYVLWKIIVTTIWVIINSNDIKIISTILQTIIQKFYTNVINYNMRFWKVKRKLKGQKSKFFFTYYIKIEAMFEVDMSMSKLFK